MSGRIGRLYKFRDFRLDTENPSLWLGDRLVPLPPKALEVLILLVSRHQGVVSREELLETVWRDTFVEEGNINYTVSLLRKTLGENDPEQPQFIQTVPKRGYRFVADVREVPPAGGGETIEPPPPASASAADTSATAAEVSAPPAPAPVSLPATQVRRHLSGFVLLGAVLMTSAAVWWGAAGRRGIPDVPAGDRNIRTVAILPLKTLTESGQSRALSLGLTDSLISRLGSLNRFTMRPLTSVRRYSEADTDPLRFGEQLRADAVLEGTLQMADNRLRVNVRLWDTRDGAQLWQGSFDETETDFFKLQDALSVRVTQSLVSQVLEKDRDLVTRRETQNREAYYAYWRGRFFLEKRSPEKAIPEFLQAIGLDPDYALAYTGLANAYSWHANFTSGADAEFYEKARALASKALELDPNLADAYTALARVQYSHDWDWAGAEKSFRRALELDSNNVDAHQFYARLLATLGRYTEGLAEINKARELDPRSADLGVPLFAILEKRGEFDEALRVLHASLEMDGDSQIARRAVGKIHLLKGEYARVIELAGEFIPNPEAPDFAWASMLATAYHRAGRKDKASAMQRHLKRLAAQDSKALYFLVMHYGELGRTDEALAALQKCLELREERMIWTKDEPRFAALKDDPRFRGILRRMNLVH